MSSRDYEAGRAEGFESDPKVGAKVPKSLPGFKRLEIVGHARGAASRKWG